MTGVAPYPRTTIYFNVSYSLASHVIKKLTLSSNFSTFLRFKRSFFGRLGVIDPCHFRSYMPTGGSRHLKDAFRTSQITKDK
jgi:hypothetical protein